MILAKTREKDRAIESFDSALKLAPEESKLYYHKGIIYYNQGIDLAEESLKISKIDEYLKMKASARDFYMKAVVWLEKAYELDPYDEECISKLYLLYNQLQMEEKENELRPLIE